MINHLQGRLVEKTPTDVVIDCGGVGYFVNISLHTFSQLPTSENVKLFTHLQVREDAHTLYGFSTGLEREIFRLLLTVSGVGASIARTMLSSLDPEQVRDAIASNDLATIQSVKGIGGKTAQRIILELKDKIIKEGITSSDQTSSLSSYNTVRSEALSALVTLGINKNMAEKTIDKILKNSGNEVTLEELIKLALKAA